MKNLLKFLWPYLEPLKRRACISILLSLPLAAIKGAQARMVKYIIDTFNGQSPFEEAILFAGLLMMLGILNYPCRYFHFYLIRYVVDRATCELRLQIYNKLQKLPLEFFVKQKSGEMVSGVVQDTDVLAQGFRNVVDVIREPITALCMFGLALYSDWQLTLVLIVVAPLFILIFQKSGRLVRDNQTKVQEEMAKMIHNIEEGIQGQKIVKTFNLQEYVSNRFNKVQDSFFKFQMKTTKVEENAHPLVELVGALAFSLVLVFAWYRIHIGAITTGDFLSFVTALALMMDPIRKFSQANVKLNQSKAAMQRIEKILSIKEEVNKGVIQLSKFNKSIELNNLSFRYPGRDEYVLKSISIQIKKGEKVAFVGGSGSGKSTLLALLMRLYSPVSGEIKLDGVSVHDYDLHAYRSIFGYVGQDVFLFHDTVQENVLLGQNKAGQLPSILSTAHAANFVKDLPKQELSMVGDRGVLLSGGQGQRLTIARAVAQGPEILLFDEATSALDNESEKIVKKALDEASRNKTVITVGSPFINHTKL